MKISVAQIKPSKGDVSSNIDAHLRLINLALTNNVDAIFFPELSLTGYEPELAKDLATNKFDTRFDIFQNISNEKNITIGVGLPIHSDLGINISSLVFQPETERAVYAKQLLHDDELPFFVPGDRQLILTIGQIKIAPAICYESLQIGHALKATDLGAEIYVASVAKSQKGVDKALVHYPHVAQKFSLPVLMANCIGFCDNFESVGQCGVWSKEGKLINQLDSISQGILIYDTEHESTLKVYLS